MNILIYGASKAQNKILKEKGCLICETAKDFWRLSFKLKFIHVFITYINPEKSVLVRNIVSKALDKGAKVKYYSKVGATPVEITDITYKKGPEGYYTNEVITLNTEQYDFITKATGITELTPEQETLTRKYLPFYDMVYPRTKLEWIESYYNIKFCLQHNVEFQYDTNRYFECQHCGNLVSRHLQDTHDCEMAEYESCYKLTKLDYIVNGII